MTIDTRLLILAQHMQSNATSSSSHPSLQPVDDIFLSPSPPQLVEECQKVFTLEALSFLSLLYLQFENEINRILLLRQRVQLDLDTLKKKPCFLSHTEHIRNGNWTIGSIPEMLQDRRVDIGSISPSETSKFYQALYSGAQGVQADLDDGHCPNWYNTILSLYNLQQASHSNKNILSSSTTFSTTTSSCTSLMEKHSTPALLLVRPRSWNMYEKNLRLNGSVPHGAIVDFAIHMFHSGKQLYQENRGPFFYLPKMESHYEARLWTQIFTWTEKQLDLPHGSIKVIVLIENICAAFEMEEILYELRDHCVGLNAGMWDYSASFISKFRTFPEYCIPDRSQYVSMECQFMKSYMELLIATCHRRKALATTGMVPYLMENPKDFPHLANLVEKAKWNEAVAGSDGALVHDVAFVSVVQNVFHQVFTQRSMKKNQIFYSPEIFSSSLTKITKDLLTIPQGATTFQGLELNVHVGIRFIHAWLHGKGTFSFQEKVEDSATAEISRSQVWQSLKYKSYLQDIQQHVTTSLVYEIVGQVVQALEKEEQKENKNGNKNENKNGNRKMSLNFPCIAGELFWDIVSSPCFENFLTTFLYQQQSFWQCNQTSSLF